MVAIAFFDLDRTLIDVNSATLWIKSEFRAGNISHRNALRAAVWIGLYGLGVTRIERAIERAVHSLAGAQEAVFRARTAAFWNEQVRHHVRPGARRRIQEHAERGHGLYLLTSSSTYISELASHEFRLDGYLANHFESENGAFTGRPRYPLCYGEGKVQHAAKLVGDLRTDLSECFFYTDSYSDLPMLQAVGHPIAVHPDPRLERYARQQQWDIEYWDAE